MSFDAKNVGTRTYPVTGGYAPFVTKEDFDTLHALYLAELRKSDGWLSPGAKLIAEERRRQLEGDCWSPEHSEDFGSDARDGGVLAAAAAAYTLLVCDQLAEEPQDFGKASKHRLDTAWPCNEELWNPSINAALNLMKAGAFIAAELDKIAAPPIPSAKEKGLQK